MTQSAPFQESPAVYSVILVVIFKFVFFPYSDRVLLSAHSCLIHVHFGGTSGTGPKESNVAMPPLDVFYPYRLRVIALYSRPSPDRSSFSLVKKER